MWCGKNWVQPTSPSPPPPLPLPLPSSSSLPLLSPCRDQSEVCVVSRDAFAPVAYLKLSKLHLEKKPAVSRDTQGK